jgi:uncharacterized protein YecT (DUF1311 family)
MTSFLRRKSVVLVIRYSVIALGGGVCAAVSGLILANAARPHLNLDPPPPDTRLTIIDGPPQDVEAAPPPPRPAPRVRRRPVEPFTEGDDDIYQTAQMPPQMQLPTPPPRPAAQMQTARMGQAPQIQAAPFNPCAGLASPADRMVCGSPRLNAADLALQRLYGMALYRSGDPDALRDEQRRWRAVRDQVAEADGPQALAELYAERIQELDGPY